VVVKLVATHIDASARGIKATVLDASALTAVTYQPQQ
jgi:hypothetical protein